MKRNWFMQYILNAAHDLTSQIAVKKGTITNAYHEAVILQLLKESEDGILKEDALALIESFDNDLDKAAKGIINSVSSGLPFSFEIVSLLPFVITKERQIGIALDGTFVASAWRLSDEAFKRTRGSKFSWMAPNGQSYVDDKSIFKRPTKEEIEKHATPILIKKAMEIGLIHRSCTPHPVS